MKGKDVTTPVIKLTSLGLKKINEGKNDISAKKNL